jgi:hypothetical protein
MTTENIKERMSTNYIRTLVNRCGYKISVPEDDHGTDISVIEVETRDMGKKLRYYDSGRELKVQSKCTTEKRIERKNGCIIFDLEAKTFNDLIYRRSSHSPLVLIVSILVEDETKWLEYNSNSLTFNKQAYWYIPSDTDSETPNKDSRRIKIPVNNLITESSIPYLLDLLHSPIPQKV